jgi:hypothetical protein
MMPVFFALVAGVREDKPINTHVFVKKEDYASYDNCENPGECSKPCANPQVYETVMCSSYLCKYCSSDYCADSCKQWQEAYPTCRCPEWPSKQNGYSKNNLETMTHMCVSTLEKCSVLKNYYYVANGSPYFYNKWCDDHGEFIYGKKDADEVSWEIGPYYYQLAFEKEGETEDGFKTEYKFEGNLDVKRYTGRSADVTILCPHGDTAHKIGKFFGHFDGEQYSGQLYDQCACTYDQLHR